MKKLIALLLFISTFAEAQFYEVEYETHVSYMYNEKGIEELKQSEPNVIERSKTIEANANPSKEYFRFIFNEKEANVSYIKKVTNGQGEIARFIMVPTNFNMNYSYFDFEKNTYLEERDLYGKKFLIENNFKQLEFIDTGKTKTILGYLTKEATYSKDNFKITVWYAPDFKKNYNVDIYTGVNGLILEEIILETYDKGYRITKIDAMKIKEIKKAKILKPTKGEKVTDQEFNVIMKEVNKKRDELYEQTNGVDKK
ncbi:GLPGLI family protein [Algoriella sp.]|uniref:GLPGLI family protein n=1 Tax=Algoriella sp. TaxID=1872434 RepID=UPI001B0D323B|nr:GLPGLI family protein [Algoriella sp.]MBO6211742.1 GLPGLI family protein [Algoriella sp.]